MLRVFRLGGMIARANIDEVSKAVLNLSKLVFYLVFYLHLVGCYLWIVAGWHAGMEYYKTEVDGKCCYQHKGGEILKLAQESGPALWVECDFEDTKWTDGPTFGDESWKRLSTTDPALSPDEQAANAEFNERWDSRKTEWWFPHNWANYVDQRTFSNEYSLAYKYLTMLYLGVLDLGSNEFGPVNVKEMAYLVLTLLSSALLNALIFGDVATLIAVISRKESAYQEKLDQANTVMKNIELDDQT